MQDTDSTLMQDTDKVVDVVIEPTADVSVNSLLCLLGFLGASCTVLEEGFISARGKRSIFAQLGKRAIVHEKQHHQIHGA